MKPKKILVPIDDSIPSRNATVYACDIASRCGAELILLHVRPSISQLIGGSGLEKVRNDLHSKAEALMDDFIAIAKKHDVKPTVLIRSGDAGRESLKVAKQENCDLIVMGSRGQHAVKGAIMGSTVTRVLQGADCPVLITKSLRKFYPDFACFD